VSLVAYLSVSARDCLLSPVRPALAKYQVWTDVRREAVPDCKSEKKRPLGIGGGFLFVDRPVPLAIASKGDSGRSTVAL
jgi:hypothetical protein